MKEMGLVFEHKDSIKNKWIVAHDFPFLITSF